MSERTVPEIIEDFLSDGPWAVVGASTNREKYGNKVLRAYGQSDREAWPINPRATEIEGLPCFPDLASLPGVPRGISIITPPKITEQIANAVYAGIPTNHDSQYLLSRSFAIMSHGGTKTHAPSACAASVPPATPMP